jgi:hypothetical protein
VDDRTCDPPDTPQQKPVVGFAEYSGMDSKTRMDETRGPAYFTPAEMVNRRQEWTSRDGTAPEIGDRRGPPWMGSRPKTWTCRGEPRPTHPSRNEVNHEIILGSFKI